MARRLVRLGAFLLYALGLASPALAVDTASAVLKDASGKELGKVTLSATPSGALMSLILTAAPPGVHALHIHAVGKCEDRKSVV